VVLLLTGGKHRSAWAHSRVVERGLAGGRGASIVLTCLLNDRPGSLAHLSSVLGGMRAAKRDGDRA